MKILSITTSSSICSVSISNDYTLINELSIDDNKTHSENLMPLIDELFKSTNMNLHDINLIVCDKGPRFFYRN